MKQTALQNNTDTIVAIATALGRGGVGVVRLSGGDLTPFIQNMLSVGDSLKPRLATFSRVLDSQQETIDEAVVLLFPSPKSFTGETVLEIQACISNTVSPVNDLGLGNNNTTASSIVSC